MDRHETPQRRYPEIDPELRKRVEAVHCPDQDPSGAYYAFNHELIWYGIDALVHVQLTRDALAVFRGDKTFGQFAADYDLHKGRRQSKFVASFSPIEQSGIYLPPQRTSRAVEVFSDDYMNICAFPSSLFRVPKSFTGDLLRREWKIEDFRNKELMLKGLWLAKNLWSISALNFESNCRPKRDRIGLPPDVVRISRELIDYYWQIVDAPDEDEPPPGQWIVYQQRKQAKFRSDHYARVFMGSEKEFGEALQQFPGAFELNAPDPQVLKVLQMDTRRKLAENFLTEQILDSDEE